MSPAEENVPGVVHIPAYSYYIIKANSPQEGFVVSSICFMDTDIKRYTIQNNPKEPQLKIDDITPTYSQLITYNKTYSKYKNLI